MIQECTYVLDVDVPLEGEGGGTLDQPLNLRTTEVLFCLLTQEDTQTHKAVSHTPLTALNPSIYMIHI